MAKRIGEEEEEKEEEKEEEEQTALIKSNNLHLAGGKKRAAAGYMSQLHVNERRKSWRPVPSKSGTEQSKNKPNTRRKLQKSCRLLVVFCCKAFWVVVFGLVGLRQRQLFFLNGIDQGCTVFALPWHGMDCGQIALVLVLSACYSAGRVVT